jgi:hypothetical protein
MVLGGRYLSYENDRGRGQMHGSKGSMSDMILVLHQSFAINAKGEYC